MIISTLAELLYLQSKHTFSKNLLLVPNVFEVFDLDANIVFTRYSDLKFLFDFAEKLKERGWLEGSDFYFTSEANTTRLNLANGGVMVDYNDYHELVWEEKPMPPRYDGLIIYFRLSFLTHTNASALTVIVDTTSPELTNSSAIGIPLTPDLPDVTLTIT